MKPSKLNALRNFRPGKTWIVLGVALGIGGVAAYAARSFLTNQMEAIDARGKGNTVTVIVAKGDIGKGVRLSSDNLALRPIPVEFAHSVALQPKDFERVRGQTLAYSVKSGEMILWGLMETQKVPTFSARVETGHRAMTVQVDEINSISGMLEPGDTIDLMVTLDQKGKKVTFPLLQKVQVMATGQRSVDDPKSGERHQYSTVTIDTTPKQAHNVIVARETGKLTALLRNPQDKQVTGGDMTALLDSSDSVKQGRASRHGVPVIYGGNLAGLTPEALRLGRAAPESRPHAVAADASTVSTPSAPAPSANKNIALKP